MTMTTANFLLRGRSLWQTKACFSHGSLHYPTWRPPQRSIFFCTKNLVFSTNTVITLRIRTGTQDAFRASKECSFAQFYNVATAFRPYLPAGIHFPAAQRETAFLRGWYANRMCCTTEVRKRFMLLLTKTIKTMVPGTHHKYWSLREGGGPEPNNAFVQKCDPRRRMQFCRVQYRPCSTPPRAVVTIRVRYELDLYMLCRKNSCRPVLSSERAPHRNKIANFRQQHTNRKWSLYVWGTN
jgi:hypothetical protein